MNAYLRLESWANEVLEQLPDTGDDHSSTLRPEALAALPSRLRSDSLHVGLSRHTYAPAFHVDCMEWRAPKATFGALGLAIIAALFSQCDLEIEIESDQGIRLLLITAQNIGNHWIPNAEFRLQSFEYWPQVVSRVPWNLGDCLDPSTLPWFCVAPAAEFELAQTPLETLVATGFGSMAASLRLAQLFLDLSRPSNEVAEVCLEVEGGNRGVAPLSCEARFWLPGSLAYDF